MFSSIYFSYRVPTSAHLFIVLNLQNEFCFSANSTSFSGFKIKEEIASNLVLSGLDIPPRVCSQEFGYASHPVLSAPLSLNDWFA